MGSSIDNEFLQKRGAVVYSIASRTRSLPSIFELAIPSLAHQKSEYPATSAPSWSATLKMNSGAEHQTFNI